MKTMYINCYMGCAGDMLMGALAEIAGEPAEFASELEGIGIPDISVKAIKSIKCGITGTHMDIRVKGVAENEHNHDHDHRHDHEHNHDHEHEHNHDHDHHHEHNHNHVHEHHDHSGMADIARIIDSLKVSDKVKEDAKNIYGIIAGAEAKVHDTEVTLVHFHEVGALDAVADVVGCAMLMEKIGADKIICSPVNTGSGTVKCAHGILPVPAPATAEILKGIPIYADIAEAELCTPTGAALLKYYVDSFEKAPVMATEKIGCGMGTKDFAAANCVRVFLSEESETANEISYIACNIDDMTAESLAFACEKLMNEGALDVCQTPVVMKKGRMGTKVECIVQPEDENKIAELMLRHTSTLGVRMVRMKRKVLKSEFKHIDTPFGDVVLKMSNGYGIDKKKAEFDVLKDIIENI